MTNTINVCIASIVVLGVGCIPVHAKTADVYTYKKHKTYHQKTCIGGCAGASGGGGAVFGDWCIDGWGTTYQRLARVAGGPYDWVMRQCKMDQNKHYCKWGCQGTDPRCCKGGKC